LDGTVNNSPDDGVETGAIAAAGQDADAARAFLRQQIFSK
jgi:hypothetical protein